jgi:uncharacterized protein (DUF58 family)
MSVAVARGGGPLPQTEGSSGRLPAGQQASEQLRTGTARTVLGSRLALFIALGALLVAFAPRGGELPFLLAYNLCLAGAFFWDRARLARAVLRVTRAPLLRCYAHQTLDYELELELLAGPSLRLSLEESAPLGFAITPRALRCELRHGLASSLTLTLCATRHGSARLSHVFVRRESALGLCALIAAHAAPSELCAYPRLPFARAAWGALALAQPGSAPKPRYGAEQGGEIERLREYVPTDPMRSIDWKASAKRRRPITRSYQPERSQILWLVLDASRAMMSASEETPAESELQPEPAPRTRFESALEAALLLASTALAQGDQVGLLVYGRALRLKLAPKRGRAQLLALIDALLHVHPEPCELDALGLIEAFAQAAPKRALFALFTDLENAADLEQLAEHARVLTRRHLALCVSLSGHELEQRLSAAIDSEADAYQRVAAIKLKEERDRLKRKLSGAGLTVIESALPGLARAALLEYQRQKRAGRL